MCAMKVPLLSRCFMATPPILLDDVESSPGESATTMLIGCDVISTTSNVNVRKRNLLIQMRRKFFRSDRDYATAARQALGLDESQVSESQSDCDSVVSKGSVDIDCKRLYYQASSSRSLPQTKNSCHRIDGKNSDAISLPPKPSTRRRLSSVESFSSAMDESCSGHSILDELLMEVYKDPYEDFLHKVKSSKKMEGKIEEIEVDVLTQLPAIKSNVSPKRMRSRRSISSQGANSARTAVPSRSNTCQDANSGPEGRDDENSKSKLQYDFMKNGKLHLSQSLTLFIFIMKLVLIRGFHHVY